MASFTDSSTAASASASSSAVTNREPLSRVTLSNLAA